METTINLELNEQGVQCIFKQFHAHTGMLAEESLKILYLQLLWLHKVSNINKILQWDHTGAWEIRASN